MSVEVYFEDGPMEGKMAARNDAPPRIDYVVPNSQQYQFTAMGSNDPVTIDTEVRHYWRERAPHRTGVVCYWIDEDARDRAAMDDSREDPRDLYEQQYARVPF